MTKLAFNNSDAANTLSSLLTAERLEKSGLKSSSRPASPDPDLEALRRVVRSTTNSPKRMSARISRRTLKTLAGV